MQALKQFNDKLADKLSDWLSTIAMFYGITFLVLLPLIWQTPKDLVGWIQYIVSVFFQGVALPILGFVSKKEGQKQAILLQEIHDAVMEEFRLAKEERTQQNDEIAQIKDIQNNIHKLLNN